MKEVTKAFENIGKEIEIRVDGMKIDGIELGRNYKENNKLLKNMYKRGKVGKRKETYVVKKMQSEIWSMQKGDSFEWLKCGMKPEKTSSIFQMSEQMVETKYWKKIRGIPTENDKCRMCGKYTENVQHILAGCEKIAGDEYLRRHNKALSVFAFELGRRNGLITEERWYKFKWEENKILENDKWKILWDFQFLVRKENVNRRPDLVVENKTKK